MYLGKSKRLGWKWTVIIIIEFSKPSSLSLKKEKKIFFIIFFQRKGKERQRMKKRKKEERERVKPHAPPIRAREGRELWCTVNGIIVRGRIFPSFPSLPFHFSCSSFPLLSRNFPSSSLSLIGRNSSPKLLNPIFLQQSFPTTFLAVPLEMYKKNCEKCDLN